jgi:peptidoglycan/xylan/chitin deacetylase (PgdA/CDA1 family)
MERHGIQAGSHTVTHPILTRISDERLRMELRDSKARLESVLGHEVSLFCYPNGATNDQVTAAVRDAGYGSAVTATPGFNGLSPDPFRLSRISAENDLPHFAQNISGFEGFKNTFRSAATSP